MTLDLHEFFEDDNEIIAVQLPGAPDLVGGTVTFTARNTTTEASTSAISCTDLTADGRCVVPLATLLASATPGTIFDNMQLLADVAGTESTYRLTVNGRTRFTVTARN